MTKPGTQNFAELELQGWSEAKTAQSYAQDFAKAAEYCVPVMMEKVGAKPGQALLDLCCGHGILSEGAVARGAKVTGADFSPAMLDLARSRVSSARFLQADAMELPFEDERFDAVVIGFGIPHVPDSPRVFSETRRVLRPGGRFAYSVWQYRAGGMQYVFEAIEAHGAPGIALPPGPGAHDYAEPDRAYTALSTAGFEDITLTDVDSRWQVNDPGAPYDFFEQGTVRGGAILRSQPAQNKRAIRDAVYQTVRANHGEGPLWDVPMPSVVVSARLPD